MSIAEEKEGVGHLTAEQVTELEQAGAIVIVPFKGRAYAFKSPDDGPWMTCFNDMQDDKKNTAMAMKTLVIRCVMTEMADLEMAIKKRPPLVQKFFAAIMEASGLDDSEAKKL